MMDQAALKETTCGFHTGWMTMLALKGREIAKTYQLALVAPSRESVSLHMGNEASHHLFQYYNLLEVSEIKKCFERVGFKTTCFDSEHEFLNWASSNLRPGRKSNWIVYAIGESGLGPGRRSLIPSFCNYYGLPFVNSGATTNCITRNKWLSYSILSKHRIRMPNTWHYRCNDGWFDGDRPRCGLKVIVKPNFESMCVGIDDKSSFDWVDSKEDFVHSVASEYDGEVVVQAFQDGFEIGAPVVRSGSQVNVIGLVGFSKKNAKTKYWKTARTFSEENLIKNVENYSVDFLDNNTILEMEDYALKISQLFQVNGFARIDFRVSLDGAPYVIDVNESPPPLLKSSLGFLMDSYGYTYEDMLAMYTALSFG